MSNNSNSNSNTSLYNICSLEHCYTNLFALSDITGIKWLKLTVRERKKGGGARGRQKARSNNLAFNFENDDDDDDDDDDEDDSDEEDSDADDYNENSETVKESKSSESKQTEKTPMSKHIKTSSVDDPILTTHAKCLAEDILCSWKRVPVQSKSTGLNLPGNKNQEASKMSFGKELWIFWFEKEEPPNLRSLISPDLVPDQSSSNSGIPTITPTAATTTKSNDILSQASSSNHGLPYECRSMLFKALHNLIERSLLAKGYARLGKWFVMPYNLNSVNYTYNAQFNIEKSNQVNSGISSSSTSHTTSQTNVKPSASSTNSSSIYSTTSTFYKLGIDDSNHVSYMFNFFLHGSSRVCTSVDMKMHKPIRCLNQYDLLKLRVNLKRRLGISRERRRRQRDAATQQSADNKSTSIPFKGLKCILGPYGVSGRLLGYVADDSTEAVQTLNEWRQFYPINLLAGLPHVFVIGLLSNQNKVKLFYPNSFVYIVMEDENDVSDDDYEHLTDTGRRRRTCSLSSESSSISTINSKENSSDDDFLNADNISSDDEVDSKLNSLANSNGSKSSPVNGRSNGAAGSKEESNTKSCSFMDSLEATIDSVARNFSVKEQQQRNAAAINTTVNESFNNNTMNDTSSVIITSPPNNHSLISNTSASASPTSKTLKRTKSNSKSNLLDMTTSATTPTGPATGEITPTQKKRKKTSLSSQPSVEAPPSDVKQALANKSKSSLKQPLSVSVSNVMSTDKMTSSGKKLLGKQGAYNSSAMRLYKRKRRFYLKQARRNKCCKSKYGLSRTLFNQLRIRHRKYTLLNENLPLAFDLIDKSSLNFCTNTAHNTAHSYSHAGLVNCISCSLSLAAAASAASATNSSASGALSGGATSSTLNAIVSPLGSNKQVVARKPQSILSSLPPLTCSCKLSHTGKKSPTGMSGNKSNPMPRTKSELVSGATSNQSLSSHTSTSSLLQPTTSILETSQQPNSSISHSIVTKLTRQPFHRRACYLDHNLRASRFLGDKNLDDESNELLPALNDPTDYESLESSDENDLVFNHRLIVSKLVKFSSKKSTVNSSVGSTVTKLVKVKNGCITNLSEVFENVDHREENECDVNDDDVGDDDDDTDSDQLAAELLNEEPDVDFDDELNMDVFEDDFENETIESESDGMGDDLMDDDQWNPTRRKKKSLKNKKKKSKRKNRDSANDSLAQLETLFDIDKQVSELDKEEEESSKMRGRFSSYLNEQTDLNMQYYERETTDRALFVSTFDKNGSEMGKGVTNNLKRVIVHSSSSSSSSPSSSSSSSSSASSPGSSRRSSTTSSSDTSSTSSSASRSPSSLSLTEHLQDSVHNGLLSDDDYEANERKPTRALANMTNSDSVEESKLTKSIANSLLKLNTKLKSKIDLLLFNENRENFIGESVEEGQEGPIVDTEFNDDEERDRSFDNFYHYETDNFQQSSIVSNQNLLLMDDMSASPYNGQPYGMPSVKSSQMTPPKSVESAIGQPVATSIPSHPPSLSTTSTAPTSSTTMPPAAAFEDLNNIFEDELTDEQQQQEPTAQDPLGISQNTSNIPHQSNGPISSISTLSVVMTPPSHETKYEDQMLNVNSVSSVLPSSNSQSGPMEETKHLILGDYSSLISENRQLQMSKQSLLGEFNVPRMSSTSIENKYAVAKTTQQVKPASLVKLKWNLSSMSTAASKTMPEKLLEAKSPKLGKLPVKETAADQKLAIKPLKKLLSGTLQSSIKLRPLDNLSSQLDQCKIAASNLSFALDDTTASNAFVNSVCLSLALSDTMMNAQRDINFDTCTMCVCLNNVKGGSDHSILIANDIYNNKLNSDPNGTQSQQQQQPISQHQQCSCGFSALVNRAGLNQSAMCVRLNSYLNLINKNFSQDVAKQNLLLPYYKLFNFLNSFTIESERDKQLLVIDSNNYNGLFFEDYLESLGITLPHHLASTLLQPASKFTPALVTQRFQNAILLKENHLARKSFVLQQRIKNKDEKKDELASMLDDDYSSSLSLPLLQESHVLDILDQSYSNPFLTVHEAFDIFYDYELDNRNQSNDDGSLSAGFKLSSELNQKRGHTSLSQFDEDSVCRNAIKSLVVDSINQTDKASYEDNFVLDKWLYKKKPLVSNLELTKSLKLIQPILEETVQKKYTTSCMWESFQGPLTWQHFCRLASGQGKSSSNSSSNMPSGSGSAGAGSGGGGASGVNSSNNPSGQTSAAEPEPIPALLVSSTDKEWQTVAPYAIKFWDKLNLEPYGKFKNIAYLIVTPDLDVQSSHPSMHLGHRSLSDEEITNFGISAIKDYFKELSSAYEMCRLGAHRPALRIAPDNGLVRVPFSYTGTKSAALNSLANVKVDQWFDKVQLNKSSRFVGKQLKLYAKSLKSLAIRIKNGYTSTISSTLESTFFDQGSTAINTSPSKSASSGPPSAKKQPLNNSNQQTAGGNSTAPTAPITNNNSFQSSFIPTMSSITLDKTIFEEMRPSLQQPNVKSEPIQGMSHTASSISSSTPSLSSLLSSGNLNGSDLLAVPGSPLDFSGSHAQAAQIIQIGSGNENMSNNLFGAVGMSSSTSGLGASMNSSTASSMFNDPSGQHTTNAQREQHLHSTLSMFNITSTPPSLFLYIVDPFEYTLYNSLVKLEQIQCEPDLEPEFAALKEEDSRLKDLPMDDQALKRLVKIGMMKAYNEFLVNLPDLFRYNTQFQFLPLSLLLDLEQRPLNACLKQMQINGSLQSNSQFATYTSSGFGSNTSDLDMDFKMSVIKQQAFNTFAKSRRYFMSPAHNFYLNLTQQPNSRAKSLTGFGPAAHEEHFLKENLLSLYRHYHNSRDPTMPLESAKKLSISKFRQPQFYSPLFILAPSTISTQAVNLLASSLFFKNTMDATAQAAHNKSLASVINGDCILQMPNFIQLNMSNSHYGYLNMNLNEMANSQQLLSQSTIGSVNGATSGKGSSGKGAVSSNGSVAGSSSGTNLSGGGVGSSSNAAQLASLMITTYQQQCNVLYVSYCLSDDQRFLLTCCTDENGELIESTSIQIEIDELGRRRRCSPAQARRIALRKLWEFILVIITQTCKPWRLVIGRLGRLGAGELRAWACLLSKKNLQHVCQQLKESCETCNTLANMETPCILSACLVSMETCSAISVYPEAYSREDRLAAAALYGQQSQIPIHAAQAHGVSCTHILTFPVSAVQIIQSQAPMLLSGSSHKDDPTKSGCLISGDDGDLMDIFNFDTDDMCNDLFEHADPKTLNESGGGAGGPSGQPGTGYGDAHGIGPGGYGDGHANVKDKYEQLLDQEEQAHLDQQPLAVGYYVSTARCGPLPKWLRGDVSTDTNNHTFKATLHISNRQALDNDDLSVKVENSHKLDSSVTYEVLRYVLERYNALSWLNVDPLIQDRKSCLPIHHSILLQMYYAFKNYV